MNPSIAEQMNRKISNIIKELNSVRYETSKDNDHSWRSMCAQILIMVQTESKRARDLVEDMKHEGLTVGLIEAEGFLRAVRTIEEEVKGILEDKLDEVQLD